MAVPLLPGSFRSQADYDRKIEDQLKYLKLRAKLNTISEQSTIRMLSGVTPVAPTPTNLDDEEMDKQRVMNLAVESLSPLTGQPVAFDFIQKYLNTMEDLQEFNDNVDAFANTLQGSKMMTPEQVASAWRRFKRSRFATMGSGASIYPLQQEADHLGYEIMSNVTGGSLQVAQLKAVVDDAVRRFDIPTLLALRRRVYG